jgi:hypothetical protein
MSKNYYGSICFTDLLNAAKEGHDGFVKSEKNGKIYANVTIWINDDVDKYGNIVSILVNNKKDSEEFKQFYIGNLKEGKPKDPVILQPGDISSLPDEDDLPF